MFSFETTAVAGAEFAAEVTGIDLTAPLAESDRSDLLGLFGLKPVLVFRDQSLSGPALAAFARTFGRIIPGVEEKYRHPETPEISFLTNVEKDGGVDKFGVERASAWHYDGGFAETPPAAAMLHALQIPKEGGGTLFADMVGAYAALPADLKRAIDGLVTVNHFGLGPEGRDYYDKLAPERWAEYKPVRRPLVLNRPADGAPYLEFCMIHTAGFVGVPHAEGYELLQRLCDHATGEAHRYYHPWRPGDVVLWDEHQTMHRNAADFPPDQPRVMMRAMVAPG